MLGNLGLCNGNKDEAPISLLDCRLAVLSQVQHGCLSSGQYICTPASRKLSLVATRSHGHKLAAWQAVKGRQGEGREKGQQPAVIATACEPISANKVGGSF